jgi:hypothetical protein
MSDEPKKRSRAWIWWWRWAAFAALLPAIYVLLWGPALWLHIRTDSEWISKCFAIVYGPLEDFVLERRALRPIAKWYLHFWQ